MRQLKMPIALSLLLGVLSSAVISGGSDDYMNVVLPAFNERIEFDKISAEVIQDAESRIVRQTRDALAQIYSVPADERTYDNTMRVIDTAQDELTTVYDIISLLANTHPEEDVREQANTSDIVLQKFFNEISLDPELYRSVKEFEATPEATNLSGWRKKDLDETLRDFRRNGFDLAPEKRAELKTLQDKLADLSTTFSKNIADYEDHLIVTEDEIAGLDDDYKDKRRLENGRYKIGLDYPSYRSFMRLSESDDARRRLYIKYNNRAADKNLDVLSEVLKLRQQLAQLLGYETYAHYRLEVRMAKTPETVWQFENDLLAKLEEKVRFDYDELLEAKRQHLNDPTVDTIYEWERGFYGNILLKTKYQLDQEKLKEYFPLENVLDGLFEITQSLFDLDYRQVEDPSVWHPDVKLYEVFQNGSLTARFYLDLHPRPNKYTHAACFPIVYSRTTDNGFQLPQASLVCNFSEPTANKPALMSHGEVITFFHEFGHVLHHILSRAELSSQAGFNVATDFVEAPSQIFENWAWNYKALKKFARHYETGEVLPDTLFQRMLAARNVRSGEQALSQVFYGLTDMTLHNRFDPHGGQTTSEVLERLHRETLPFPFVEGTNYQAAFSHLMGYSAGYYGYLWSRVYAEDMFSLFEQNGVFDKETGRRYRDIILAQGSTRDELELVRQFLGREPNPDAFLRSLGLTVQN